MTYAVSDEIRNRTNCRNEFHCLSGDMQGVCDVYNTLGTKLIVTDCPKRGWYCDYCKAFDISQGFCTCPTRIEIYNRYRV